MSKYIITGGNKLQGKVKISGNKNATFPVIAAALLTQEEVVLNNIPEIADVGVMIDILNALGVSTNFSNNQLTIQAEEITTTQLPEDLTTRLRGSVVLAGALLSRMGKAGFAHPGGDTIGKRSIDVHLKGFEAMGYKVQILDRKYEVKKDKDLTDVKFFLEEASVTGTENLILAAALRMGKTILRNCAQEPHIVDLCQMLISMGGKIEGVGSSILTITGVSELSGTEYTIGSDEIVFGTYALAAALTGGKIEIENCRALDLDPIMTVFGKSGIDLDKNGNSITVSSKKIESLGHVKTNIWPGFPTDLMSPLIVLATQANGVTLLHDWMYESRFFFVDKLIAMGAQITIADPHRVVVYGPTPLRARDADTPDIRAGMALLLAALIADGTSTINRAELIERGYEDVVEKLRLLGADIQRVQ
jgi:UDP-N-acetylglucosamine 1-carboxyvinyltransferase